MLLNVMCLFRVLDETVPVTTAVPASAPSSLRHTPAAAPATAMESAGSPLSTSIATRRRHWTAAEPLPTTSRPCRRSAEAAAAFSPSTNIGPWSTFIRARPGSRLHSGQRRRLQRQFINSRPQERRSGRATTRRRRRWARGPTPPPPQGPKQTPSVPSTFPKWLPTELQ